MARRERRKLLRRMAAAWIALSTLGAGFVAVASRASAAPQYDVVNLTVNAAAVHIIANSAAFPNFRTGLLDNSYAYAHAHVDGSPFSQGRSSPFDTGPGFQLEAAQNGFQQPQYTDVRYPPSNQKPQEFGSASGPAYAESYARENYAFAKSSEVGSTSAQPQTSQQPQPGSSVPAPAPSGSLPVSTANTSTSTTSAPVIKMLPVGFHIVNTPWGLSLQKLNAFMLAWRARWLSADDAARFPVVLADASQPDGQDGVSSITEAAFNDGTGVLTTMGDARAAFVSLGGGAIVLHGVHTTTKTTDDGSGPQSTTTIKVASAEIGGVPVTFDQNGVSVNGTQIPGLADAITQANDQLNQGLAQSGWTITAPKPAITLSNGEKAIDASALHIKFQQPQVASGVPPVYAEYWIGQVFSDSLGVTSVPLIGGVAGTGGSNVGGVQTQFIPGTQGTPGTPGSQGSSVGESGLAHLLRIKPLYLLLLYFLWQALIIGTGASLWWMRMGGKPA